MNDIVTRLRKEWAACQTCMAGIEASDEIERLRRELHMAEKWRDNYKLALESRNANGDR